MRLAAIISGCACVLSGCTDVEGTTTPPQLAAVLSANETCMMNFGLNSISVLTLSNSDSQQFNACISQLLADTSAASGGLVPLEPLTPVAAPVESVAAVVPAPAGCIAGGGVFQGGVGYCVGQMR